MKDIHIPVSPFPLRGILLRKSESGIMLLCEHRIAYSGMHATEVVCESGCRAEMFKHE
jgi:hypothetical protein